MMARKFSFKKCPLFFRKHLTAIAIVIVFLVLMLLHAGNASYWLDELYSVYMRGIFYKTTSEHINAIKTLNPTLPLYEITLYNWMKIFGDKEFSTRSLSILFTSGAGFFLYLFMYRIYKKKIALLSLLLFLFSALTIKYSLESRYYGQMLFLSALSSYSMLLYIFSLQRHDSSFKKMFLNGHFVLLTIVNAALLLNHLFNYLFFMTQAVVFTGWLLFNGKCRGWFVITMKGALIYLAPIFLIFLVWPYTYSIYNGHGLIFYLKKIFEYTQLFPLIFSSQIFKISVMLGFLTLTLSFLFPDIVKYFKANDTFKVIFKKARLLFVGKILIVAMILGLFFFGFPFFSAEANKMIRIPYRIILNSTVFPNMQEGWFLNILMSLALILPAAAVFNLKPLNENRYLFFRKLFLVYSAMVVIFAAIFTSLIFSQGHNRVFYLRYLLFGLPCFICILSVTTYVGIRFLIALMKKIFHISATRIFLRSSFIISVLLTLTLMGTKAYKAPQSKTSWNWRAVAEEVSSIAYCDSSHKYCLAESATRMFPTLDYYLKRFSPTLRVGFIFSIDENDSLKINNAFVPQIFAKENLLEIEKHDYLIVTFLHRPKNQYSEITSVLDNKYKLKEAFLNKKNRGFIIYEVHHDK